VERHTPVTVTRVVGNTVYVTPVNPGGAGGAPQPQ
jgi:hypothetical protein